MKSEARNTKYETNFEFRILDLFRISIFVFMIFVLLAHAQTSGGNASLSLKKDAFTGLFILNMRDPQGIRSFQLIFPNDNPPYGGDLGGCPQTRKNDNVTLRDPSDFNPQLKGIIIDCQGGETEFEILKPVDGVAEVKRFEPAPPPPPPTPNVPAPPPPAPIATPSPEPVAEDPLADVTYPVKELGGCKDEKSCKSYCELPGNIKECLKFAEEHTLIPKDEIERGQKFAAIMDQGGGPGGCKTQKTCESYCNDVNRIDECIAFAEANNFMDQKELDEAKKVQAAIKGGAKLPGGCVNKAACETYCQVPDHMDECIAFAKSAGFLSEEELKEIDKILPLMKSGQMPGGCKSKETCEAFCEDEGHFDECVAFAEKAGFISQEELEMVKKTGGKGPGGCRGRACKTFCDNPDNQEACFEFAKEHGLISEDDLRQMEEGKGQLEKVLEEAPPEVKECVESILGPGGLEKMGSGFGGGKELGEKIKGCFEKMFSQFGGGPGGPDGGGFPGGPDGGPPGGGFSGPGGCTGIDECMAYCKDNPKECEGFGPPPGGGMPGGGPPGGDFPGGSGGFPGGGIPSGADYVGPGGCRTPEGCIRYCKEPEHEKECNEFETPATTPRAPGRGPGGQSDGPGGCASVEECREYCNANQQVCDDFVSEDVPPEGKCQAGFQIERDAIGYKYCNPISCPEGQAFHTDVLGRRACSPVGIPGGPKGSAPPIGGCEAFMPGCPGFGPPAGGGIPSTFQPITEPFQQGFTAPPTPEQIQQQIQQQIPTEFQQFAPPPTPPSSSLPFSSLLGAVLRPWLLFLK